MRPFLAAGVLELAFVLFFATGAPATELGMVTGSEKGTCYRMALDMKKEAFRYGMVLSVYPSRGAVDNVYAVFKRPWAQLGVVQSDVLAFVARVQNRPALRKMAENLRVVFPLYDEEVHVLSRSDLSGLEDLEGRDVAVGEEGSGTYLTAKLLLELTGVKPRRTLTLGPEEALVRLKKRELDALFYVSGAPVPLFTEAVKTTDELKLLPIAHSKVTSFYPSAEISSFTYPWQKETVATVAVKAVLVTYNYQGANCEKVGRFARIVVDNLERLRRNGHPKWRSVNVDASLPGWRQYDCVTNHLLRKERLEPEPPPDSNPVLEAIDEFF